MSIEEEFAELNSVYWAQQGHLEQLEAQLVMLHSTEERMTQLETLLKDFSDFVGSIPALDLDPPMLKQRAVLQARAWEVLEGREKG